MAFAAPGGNLDILRPPPGAAAAPVQLTRINVDYNFQDEVPQGKLIMEIKALALRGPDFWETFPGDFYGRLEQKLAETAVEEDEKPAVATIREKIARYRLPWVAAGAGKRLQGGLDTFDSIKVKVGQDVERHETYQKYIDTALQEDFASYSKRNFIKEYLKMKREDPDRLAADDTLHGRLRSVLAWYAPLQAEQVKGLQNKEAMIQGMCLVMTDFLSIFESYSEAQIKRAKRERIKLAQGSQGASQSSSESSEESDDEFTFIEPPKDARVRKADAKTIHGHQVGQRSEIETGLSGALRSGEKASPRNVETLLSKQLMEKHVAGHLVADTLGGKNADYNLTPITNTFNTTGGVMGIKDPEIEGLKRLKAGEVIRYSCFVTYGAESSSDWWKAVRPTKISIEINNLKLRELRRDGSKIDNYTDDTEHGDPKTYNLFPL